MTVYESALPPGLKMTCAALALFADAHGGSIYPSLARVGWLIGKSERQVRSDVAALVDRGVLIELTPRQGGRGRTTRFRIDATAVPKREPFDYKKGGSPHPGNARVKPETYFRLSDENPEVDDRKGGSGDGQTRKFDAVNPEADFRGSVRDQELISEGISTATRTPRYEHLAKEPNGDNFDPVRKIAVEVKKETGLGGADLVEAVKQRCADERVDYGRHDAVPFNVVHRACAWVELQPIKARIA